MLEAADIVKGVPIEMHDEDNNQIKRKLLIFNIRTNVLVFITITGVLYSLQIKSFPLASQKVFIAYSLIVFLAFCCWHMLIRMAIAESVFSFSDMKKHGFKHKFVKNNIFQIISQMLLAWGLYGIFAFNIL